MENFRGRDLPNNKAMIFCSSQEMSEHWDNLLDHGGRLGDDDLFSSLEDSSLFELASSSGSARSRVRSCFIETEIGVEASVYIAPGERGYFF